MIIACSNSNCGHRRLVSFYQNHKYKKYREGQDDKLFTYFKSLGRYKYLRIGICNYEGRSPNS